jgi:light-regulated signal transduction histidine kinase (bacteriophytochrome)
MLSESAAGKLSEGEHQYMVTIEKAAQRMSHLIDDLLAFSRIGRSGLNKRDVDMNALVQECLREMQPDLERRRIEWEVLPLPPAPGDHNLLRQVWVNLLANAVKYTRPRDPAKIHVAAARQDNEIIFYVRDNGVGFDMSYADKLFGVFQRLHSESEFEGTGIGLANVRRIVQRHGGRTWAEAKEGEGAKVYFSLPAV